MADRIHRPSNVVPIGRELPHSVDAEEYLLSCMFLDGGPTYAKAAKRLKSGAFYVAANRALWKAYAAHHQEHGQVAIEHLAEAMRDAGTLAEVGGLAYLMQVSGRSPTTAQADYFIDQLAELWRRRESIKVATEIVEQCHDGSALDDAEGIGGQVARLQDLARFSKTSSKLPPILSWGEFVGEEMERPPELVSGVLHRGAKMMLAGGSKSFKTWVLIDLALSVATGTPFWGMRTAPGRVLYVNYELSPVFFQDRVKAIAEAKGIAEAPDFTIWNLRGHAGDLRDQVPHFVTQTGGAQYSLIVLDPIYKCLGERDENSNGEVADLLNLVESLTVKLNAAVAFGHHFSKGNKSETASMDRMSGAGAWARDPDALVTLTPHEEEDHFTVDFTLRNLKPHDSQVVKWEFPCMRPDDGLDPSALRKPGRPKARHPKEVAKIVASGCSSYSQILEAAQEQDISRSSVKRLMHEALERGLIEKVGNMYLLPKNA